MIRIICQDGIHQYDNKGNAITTWDNKKCSWIVNPEYENEKIDWWGKDNDSPRGYTLEEFERNNPSWDKMPNIEVIWTWDPEGYKKAFDDDPPKNNNSISCNRYWGYLGYSEDEAIERLGRYYDFHKYAMNTRVIYNEKVIFNGKLD